MLDSIEKLISIKRSFAETYSGSAHIQEVIPSTSESFQIDSTHLSMLHKFAKSNPIYTDSYEIMIQNITCIVYEGDISEYWLDSIKHSSSCQPFYPTWIVSAYFLARIASELGFEEMVDVGSGDGRIAFCGRLCKLDTFSVEIDERLTKLQSTMCDYTHQNFNPICGDAFDLDYRQWGLGRPVFFIGGLPQMGGDMLADGIIKKLKTIPDLKDVGIVLAGTHTKKDLSANAGWDPLIEKYDLKISKTVSLPTSWTFDQKDETPYTYCMLSVR